MCQKMNLKCIFEEFIARRNGVVCGFKELYENVSVNAYSLSYTQGLFYVVCAFVNFTLFCELCCFQLKTVDGFY